MEHSKTIAIRFFESLGFTVADIPTSNEKRADVLANDGDHEYITEVKERLDDPETIASQLTSVSVGEEQVSFRVSPLDRSNRLDGIFKASGKQLKETPSSMTAYRLIWLHCDGLDAELQEIRARNTFYGIVPVIPQGCKTGSMCFYFDFNTAFMMPQVNGVLIAAKGGLRLYINEFALAVDRFRCSKLVRAVGDAVFDPTKIVANEEHIAFRGNVSRKDESVVLHELEKQTGIR